MMGQEAMKRKQPRIQKVRLVNLLPVVVHLERQRRLKPKSSMYTRIILFQRRIMSMNFIL